ncbi:MAG: hypothetical protein RLZZ433_137 [Pseudomonadota bacterium]|jgi:hypothetical protein
MKGDAQGLRHEACFAAQPAIMAQIFGFVRVFPEMNRKGFRA